jgi:diguanylate cyclase (GGDEF)-like protein
MNDDILLVDDDPGTIHHLARILAGSGKLRFATSGKVALQLARESPPDLILLDAEMPGMSGFEVLDTLKAEPAMVDVPVIFVTSHSDTAFEVAGFEQGAADFITKPVNARLVLARVKAQLRVKRMADELRRISTTDFLTNVANRRRFDESLEREWLRARRAGDPVSLLMVDVDHFKLYNDRYGHPQGDACLRNVAQALIRAGLRPADLVARYGGEEFMLLLPQTARRGAECIAHRILDAIEAMGIPHETSPTARIVTVSIGIACHDDASACWVGPSADSRFAPQPHARCSVRDLVQAVDKALYAAKRAGRAQASLLDISDVDTPQLASSIASSCQPRATELLCA